MADDWAQRALGPRCSFTGPFIDKRDHIHWEQCSGREGHRFDHHWGRLYAPNIKPSAHRHESADVHPSDGV